MLESMMNEEIEVGLFLSTLLCLAAKGNVDDHVNKIVILNTMRHE